MKVTRMVVSYQQGACCFGEIYDEVEPELKRRMRGYMSRFNVEHNDVISAFDMAITKAIRDFDGTKGLFSPYLWRIVKNEIITIVRNLASTYEKEVYEPDGVEHSFFERKDDSVDLFKEVMRKEQRELLLSIKQMVLDDVAVRLMDEFPNYDSLTQLGEAVGLESCNLTVIVQRRIQKVAKYYRSDIFGNYRDYLTA